MGHFPNNNIFATYRIYQRSLLTVTILSMPAQILDLGCLQLLITVGPLPPGGRPGPWVMRGYAGLWVLRCKFGCKSRFGSCRNLWVMGVYGL